MVYKCSLIQETSFGTHYKLQELWKRSLTEPFIFFFNSNEETKAGGPWATSHIPPPSLLTLSILAGNYSSGPSL
jgi:hypothetical protein